MYIASQKKEHPKTDPWIILFYSALSGIRSELESVSTSKSKFTPYLLTYSAQHKSEKQYCVCINYLLCRHTMLSRSLAVSSTLFHMRGYVQQLQPFRTCSKALCLLIWKVYNTQEPDNRMHSTSRRPLYIHIPIVFARSVDSDKYIYQCAWKQF